MRSPEITPPDFYTLDVTISQWSASVTNVLEYKLLNRCIAQNDHIVWPMRSLKISLLDINT